MDVHAVATPAWVSLGKLSGVQEGTTEEAAQSWALDDSGGLERWEAHG